MSKKVVFQKSVWDKIAKPWSEFRDKPLLEVMDFLKDKSGKVLDIACGSGRHFIHSKCTLYGVDFSKSMLKLARAYAKKEKIPVKLKEACASSLPFKNNFFDSAIFIAALHCIPAEKKREKALRELFRVLKPKSQALITVWSKHNERTRNKLKEALIPWTVDKKKYERYYYIYDKEELEALLEKVGFDVLFIKEDKNISIIVEKP